MSKSSSGSRRIRVGLVVGAIATVLLGILAVPPVSAAPAAVATPDSGPVGGGNTVAVVLSGYVATFPTTATVGARLQTGTGACAAFGTASATNLAATVSRIDANTVNVTIPSGVVLGTVYRICIYGVTTGTPLTGTVAVGQDDYTIVADAPVLSPVTGPAGGLNTITATGTGPYLTGSTAAAAVFSTATCAATYPTIDATHIAATTTRTDSVATITVPAGAVAPNAYYVCVYRAVTSGSLLVGQGSAVYTPGAPEVDLSVATGPNAGGNTVTATSAAFSDLGVTVPGVNFSTTDCSATYENTGAAADLAGAATRSGTTISFVVPVGVLAPSEYNVCLYAGSTDETSMLLAVSSEKYTVALPDITTSPNVGPTATAKTITVTGAVPFLNGVATPGATFSVGACLSTYLVDGTHFAATAPKRITTSIASLGVPTTVVLASGNTTAYNVCVYSGTAVDSVLVADPGTYTVAAVFTVDVDPIDLDGGPAQGGTLITITGTGFPTGADAITASLGGSPLTSVKRGSGGTTFTGITTAHAPGAVALSVTTAAGTIVRANAFTYSYGITIQPNTSPTDESPDLYITGAGFLDLDFAEGGEASNNGEAHIYLVKGVYSWLNGSASPAKDNPPVAECEAAFALSDTALLCSLNLEDSLDPADGTQDVGTEVPDGTYTMTVVNSGFDATQAVVPNPDVVISASILTSGSTFTVAQY